MGGLRGLAVAESLPPAMPRALLRSLPPADDPEGGCQPEAPPCAGLTRCRAAALGLLLLAGLIGGVVAWQVAPARAPQSPPTAHGTASYGDPDCPQMAGMVMPCPLSASPSAPPPPPPTGNASSAP